MSIVGTILTTDEFDECEAIVVRNLAVHGETFPGLMKLFEEVRLAYGEEEATRRCRAIASRMTDDWLAAFRLRKHGQLN